jgi:hypothetical protein
MSNEWFDEQAENEATDALLRRLAQRRIEKSVTLDDGLVYKTAWTPERVLPPERATASNLDDDSWNRWAQTIARRAVTEANDVLVGDLDGIHEKLWEQIAELERKLADLERRADVLEGKAAPVVPLRGGKSAA